MYVFGENLNGIHTSFFVSHLKRENKIIYRSKPDKLIYSKNCLAIPVPKE